LLYKYKLDEEGKDENKNDNKNFMHPMCPSEIVSNVVIHTIPENVYSYFTFTDTKNKLIQQLKI